MKISADAKGTLRAMVITAMILLVLNLLSKYTSAAFVASVVVATCCMHLFGCSHDWTGVCDVTLLDDGGVADREFQCCSRCGATRVVDVEWEAEDEDDEEEKD